MPQFFFQSSNIKNNEYTVKGEDYHHLAKVRRIKIEDSINLRDEFGVLYLAQVIKIDDESITFEIKSKINESSSKIKLSLYVALLKGAKLDLVIQKAVEIGVNEIIPVKSERSIKYPDDKLIKKVERWNKIALEASKQSMRNHIPEVKNVETLDEVINSDLSGIKIMANPDAQNTLKKFLRNCDEKSNVNLLVGPEGGFCKKEIQNAESNGWNNVTFGFTELRAETAGIVLPSLIIYEIG